MGLMRGTLLAASRSRWLRERATRCRFVQRAVSRFMPGETLDDALAAAGTLRSRGMTAVLTCLGENVANEAEAAAVADHYLDVLDRMHEIGLNAEISVKLTHLGLDLDPAAAAANLARIARRAMELKNRVWIDMEDSSYTDATIRLFRECSAGRAGLGLCLQAYLHRTRADLEALLPLAPAIRLVKGAYKEPPSRALPRKRDVDENFFALATRLLSDEVRGRGGWTVFGTHDPLMIRRIVDLAAARRISSEAFEFDLLYGIRRDIQGRLTSEGHHVRVLISYGSFWFPWYMRRLAERPANLWFVARSVLGGA